MIQLADAEAGEEGEVLMDSNDAVEVFGTSIRSLLTQAPNQPPNRTTAASPSRILTCKLFMLKENGIPK